MYIYFIYVYIFKDLEITCNLCLFLYNCLKKRWNFLYKNGTIEGTLVTLLKSLILRNIMICGFRSG